MEEKDLLLFIGKKLQQGFSGDTVGKNPPANQCRGHGFHPWKSGKIPRDTEQLSPCTTKSPQPHKPVRLETVPCNKKATTRRSLCTAGKSSPYSLKLEDRKSVV